MQVCQLQRTNEQVTQQTKWRVPYLSTRGLQSAGLIDLFTGPMAKDEEEIKCKDLLCWSGEHGIELFNSWDMSAEEQNPVTFKEVRDMIRRSQKSQQTNSFG